MRITMINELFFRIEQFLVNRFWPISKQNMAMVEKALEKIGQEREITKADRDRVKRIVRRQSYYIEKILKTASLIHNSNTPLEAFELLCYVNAEYIIHTAIEGGEELVLATMGENVGDIMNSILVARGRRSVIKRTRRKKKGHLKYIG